MLRLIASMTADAVLTVASCGIYPAMRAAEGNKSFTGQTLDAIKREKEEEKLCEAIKTVPEFVRDKQLATAAVEAAHAKMEEVCPK
ncbi:MAG: hypothetical protein LBV80_08160 [Deltaproteobacteria bacterium]|jgi:hypothetical protein|nr:hypothetical protein [Deltaproteobacteria bacterium]